MDLYLVRHAIAEDATEEQDDALRPLTRAGRKRFAREVRGLARIDVGFDRVLFSPLLRAQETAELLAPICDGELEVDSALAQSPGEELVERLARRTEERLALVGHEPYLSHLCGWLMFGWRVFEDRASARTFTLEKGGVAHLRGAPVPGSMSLVAFYPASALRKLARR
jgi:phosphohistidine phosphatase